MKRKSSDAATALEFSEDDREILIKFVKLCQLENFRGTHGDWKEFIRHRDGSNTLFDPAKRSWDVLAEYVQTLTDRGAIKVAKRLKTWKNYKSQCSHITDYLGTSPYQELVRQTYENRNFGKLYSFPSYKNGWMLTKLVKPEDSGEEENIIVLHCKKATCGDGLQETVQVCVVDHDLKKLLNLFVKPSNPLLDSMSDENQFEAEPPDGAAPCNLKDAQRMLKRIIKPNTIIVGHRLHDDLRALQLDHAKIVDTALIFQYQNKSPNYIPSLKKLCKAAMLNSYFDEGDKQCACVNEAIAIMKLVKAKIKFAINFPIYMGNREVSKEDLSKLFIHKIPPTVCLDDLQKLFPNYSVKFEAFSKRDKRLKCTSVVFQSCENADEAFQNLIGELGVDQIGRPQKRVLLTDFKNGGKGCSAMVYVRKMVAEDGEDDQSDMDKIVPLNRRIENAEEIPRGASHMHPSITDSCICVHMEENDRLRKELEAKNEKIRQLRSRISVLTKEPPY